MATIREVSRLAGVSNATVSRVLNGTVPVSPEVTERVLAAVEQLGYRPNAFARGLVTNRSGGLGVCVNDVASPYFGLLIRGVEAEAEAAGMHLLVSSGHAVAEQERAGLEFLADRRSDALVAHIEAMPDDALAEYLARPTPLILVGRKLEGHEERCVYLDNEAGGVLATRHLLEHGHTRIGHITGPERFPDSRARRRGFEGAMRAVGLEPDGRLVIEADFEEAGGFRAMRELLERDPGLTAVFAGNDQMAAGAFAALRESGRNIPDDVSVVGYDDVLLARYLHPTLTTIRQPLEEMGRAAARAALALLANEGTEVRNRFDPQLVSRQSVARPR
ncbi:MAG: LacI family DNA-binding transcriptional regulator [Trueperaceae bacterium]|nr:LacI family DNA-binding transcriptional regulator [Trueperaceae bacterium]MCO5174373.1 LacI family transcriptional regulator [Trueperaceae bacterium]MCW5819991.1 LacI family DNA-binding transcriptional regulator [Trueperaceae bacterium]